MNTQGLAQTEKDKKPEEIKLVTTPAFKLKDKVNRNYQPINLRKQFDFIPDVIVVEKVPGQNNVLVVHAVVKDTQSGVTPKSD